MSTRILRFLTPVLQPLYWKFVSKTRRYRYKSIRILVFPGVFYPGFILSTRIFLKFIDSLEIEGKSLLELGAGSGIISLLAARKGAKVTSTDINPLAISNITDNMHRNVLDLTVIQSDLFKEIPQTHFDYILINPPFYPKSPANFAQMAWYCGENFEYFEDFFQHLQLFYGDKTIVLMLLSEDCDIEKIKHIAAKQSFEFSEVHKKKKMGEWSIIFRINKIQTIQVD
jgi:release factor glutamine methyltransferase